MSRLKKLKAAWFVVVANDQRPSRRSIQEACKRNFGSAFHTDEVAEFLRAWQYVGADGLFYLRESLGPVGVQPGSSSGPPLGPVTVLKNAEMGPVEESQKTTLGPTCADLEDKIETKNTNPQSANALSPPKGDGRVRPNVDPVEFSDEDERRVKQLMVFVAAENKTGTLSAGRVLALRAEIHAERESLGPERWRYGIDEANSRGRPWSYARAVMRKHVDVPQVAVRAGPHGRRPGYSDAPPPPEKLERYAKLGRKIHENALREQSGLLDRVDPSELARSPGSTAVA